MVPTPEEDYPRHERNKKAFEKASKFHQRKSLWGRVFLQLILQNEEMLKEFYKSPTGQRQKSLPNIPESAPSDGPESSDESDKDNSEDSSKSDDLGASDSSR